MDDLQQEYRDRVNAVLELKVKNKVKVLLIDALMSEMRELQDLNRNYEMAKGRVNY
jgi:hypothetical protein